MSAFYQIQHLSLTIADRDSLMTPTSERLLAMFQRPGGVATAEPTHRRMHLDVHSDPTRAEHATVLPLAWQGAHDGVRFAVYRRAGRRRIELPGRAVVDFDLTAGWAALWTPSPLDASAHAFLLLRLVCEALTRDGHAYVRAACLAAPLGGRWHGVLVAAPTNAGKTTTALALAGAGWRLLGDDISYVRPPHLGTAVWGFPRHCNIRPGALALLPWLADVPLGPPDHEGARTVPLARLGACGWVDGAWLEPALVVVLGPPNRRGTFVEPIDRATALNQLAAASQPALLSADDEDDAARDFVTLGRLVCAAPACRLSAGPQVTGLAERLERFLLDATADRRANWSYQRAA